jgi:heat shock protein HslJ
MRTPCLVLLSAALIQTACASSLSPEQGKQFIEGNRWELVRWGDQMVPHVPRWETESDGQNGEPIILGFRDGRVSSRMGCNRYSAGIAFRADAGEVKITRGMATRLACEPRRMEFEAAFIRAFESSTHYHVEGERLLFESGTSAALEFYRRPLEK